MPLDHLGRPFPEPEERSEGDIMEEEYSVEVLSGDMVEIQNQDGTALFIDSCECLNWYRRVAACLNACRGIRTAELEEGQFFMTQKPETQV